MLIELFIAARLNSAANSLKQIQGNSSSDAITDTVFDWIERRELKREMERLEKESELFAAEFERPVSRPDTSKQKRNAKK